MTPKAWLEAFHERCAIVEYDANVPRELAEQKAWDMTVESCGPAPRSCKRPQGPVKGEEDRRG